MILYATHHILLKHEPSDNTLIFSASGVDFYIELLRKDQLDENVPVETLEKALHYFEHIYPMHLGEERLDHTSFLQNQLRVFESASDCLGSYLQIGKALLQDGQDSSEMGVLLKTSEGEVNEIKTTVKNMKRRMPQVGLAACRFKIRTMFPNLALKIN